MRIHADPDPDPCLTLKSQKAEFLQKNILLIGNGSKSIPTKVQKPLKGSKPGLFVNFCRFQCSWIRISIPNTDLDPGQPFYQCGPMRIRIHNTGYNRDRQ
jgi:hypothetical protein